MRAPLLLALLPIISAVTAFLLLFCSEVHKFGKGSIFERHIPIGKFFIVPFTRITHLLDVFPEKFVTLLFHILHFICRAISIFPEFLIFGVRKILIFPLKIIRKRTSKKAPRR